MAHQLYAKIKKSSKYYYQNDWAKAEPNRWGWPFKVEIVPGDPDGYIVKGGPGGQYRLSDVNLYVIVDDSEIKLA